MEALLLIAALCTYSEPCVPPPPDVAHLGEEWHGHFILVMPGNMPDVETSVAMDSPEQCWEIAKEWVKPEHIGKKNPKSIGLAAGCYIIAKPSVSQ